MSSEFSFNNSLANSTFTDFQTNVSASSKAVEPSVKQATSDLAEFNTVKDLEAAGLQGRKITIGEEETIRIIERANKALQGVTTTFEFSIHKATKEIMVKVLDKETGKVIREIPPEKTLDMVAKLWEKAGIIIDERG